MRTARSFARARSAGRRFSRASHSSLRSRLSYAHRAWRRVLRAPLLFAYAARLRLWHYRSCFAFCALLALFLSTLSSSFMRRIYAACRVAFAFLSFSTIPLALPTSSQHIWKIRIVRFAFYAALRFARRARVFVYVFRYLSSTYHLSSPFSPSYAAHYLLCALRFLLGWRYSLLWTLAAHAYWQHATHTCKHICISIPAHFAFAF